MADQSRLYCFSDWIVSAETRDPEYWFTAEFSKQSNPRGAVRHLLEVQDSTYLQVPHWFEKRNQLNFFPFLNQEDFVFSQLSDIDLLLQA